MRESDLFKEIQVRLSVLGHRLFRNNVGALKDEKGHWVRYGVCNPGGADGIGWTKDGRFLAVETKSETGRMRPGQQEFIDAVNKAGGVGVVARSVEDAVNAVENGDR